VELGRDNFVVHLGEEVTVFLLNNGVEGAFWEVKPSAGAKPSKGKGDIAGPLQFGRPGDYQVIYSVPAHGSHAAARLTASVKVLPFKISFVPEKAVFSEPLKKGIPADGIKLSLPVMVESFENKPVPHPPLSFIFHGETGLKLEQTSTAPLKSGEHMMEFTFRGTPDAEGGFQIQWETADGNTYFLAVQVLP
jgi:hypothetical protein